MKIEIPESVKEVLRCVECNELLSCGPVYLVHETSAAICGRCSQQSPEEEEEDPSSTSERSRNLQYEATAKLLLFPCRFSDQGCTKQMDFSEEEPNIHEHVCEFRTFICPIVSSGSCNWVNSHQKLSEHCRHVHPGHFFENPCVLPRPDLTKSNLSNFLVSAFNFLFLLHVKVCVTSGKLFHSVRMFGNSELLDKFSYSFKIEGNCLKVKKEGSVLRAAGIMMLQEPTAICTRINSLLDILDGKYDESIFTFRIRASFKFCVNCSKNIVCVYHSIFCEECDGKLAKCKFNEEGCLFVDVNKDKCWKHEEYYCEYLTQCNYCEVDLVGGSYVEHLASSYSCEKIIKVDINSVVRVTTNIDTYYDIILFSTNNIGTILCKYDLNDFNFELLLHTPLPSHELKNYKCSIELTDPQTNHTRILKPEIVYGKPYDWYIYKKIYNFSSWKNIGIDLKLNIDKHQN